MAQLSRFQDIKHSWNSQVWQYRFKWKTTFNGKQPSMKDNLWWKIAFNFRMTFDRGNPLMKYHLRWHIQEEEFLSNPTIYGRQLLNGYNILWEITFGGKQSLLGDHYWWNKIFEGSWPLMQDNLWNDIKELLNWRCPKLKYDAKYRVLLINLTVCWGGILFFPKASVSFSSKTAMGSVHEMLHTVFLLL